MNDEMQAPALEGSLDARQRQMLQAMGIKLWLPEAPAAQHAPDAPAHTAMPLAAQGPAQQAKAEPVHRPMTTKTSEQKQPLASVDTARNAIKNIANGSFNSAAIAAPMAFAPRPAGIAQMDWAALQTAVSSCQACALCQSRKNTVFGSGQPAPDASQAPQADWLFIGDPPDADEDAQSEPFAGQSGQLLDNMLAAIKMGVNEAGQPAGLSRKNSGTFITNVLKCRPPVSRNPSAEEVAMCAPYLARQIELLRPKIIVAMGKFAIASLTGSNEPLGKLRGRLHRLEHTRYSAPVIVTYHPAYLLRTPGDKAKSWADLLLAMQTYRELSSA